VEKNEMIALDVQLLLIYALAPKKLHKGRKLIKSSLTEYGKKVAEALDKPKLKCSVKIRKDAAAIKSCAQSWAQPKQQSKTKTSGQAFSTRTEEMNPQFDYADR
jgi:hypothetical protein